VTPRARVVIQKALSTHHEVVLKETNRRGHAARLAQGAVADGIEVVVVLGGDGTLNEAANGLAGTTVALAVLPGGSTNVFARTIGLANDPIEATNQILSGLEAGPAQRVGLGQAKGRSFLFHAGIGFDAAVVARVERLAPLKRYTGPLVFVWAALSTWANGYDRHRPHFALRSGGEKVAGCYFAVCLNTDPYTFLGSRPLHLAPGTTLDQPLSIIAFRRLSLADIVPAAVSALSDGRHLGRAERVWAGRRLAQISVRSERGVPYQLDGDYVGEAHEIELSWQPGVLSLVLPAIGSQAVAAR
jgi:diacylglycerol kinase family enzyme